MRNTLAGHMGRANTPGWLWAAGTNTARLVVSGGLGIEPSGFLLEDSMTYSPAGSAQMTGGAR
ncbi:hypothetical protein [Streptomyces sp. NPDC057496]|uniref:hypothetical protein n=1 Tax=Streptomyces sp. NPDC057496 TaxID=3346149 RepID=UPI00368A387E